MQQFNSEWRKHQENHPTKSTLIQSLPFIDQTKISTKTIEQTANNYHSNKHLRIQDQDEQLPKPEKHFNQQMLFSKFKDAAIIKGKATISPKKITLKEKILQSVEGSPIRKKMQESIIRQKGPYKQQSPINSIMRINVRQEEKQFKLNQQPPNRAFLYQPYKKRSAANHREKLRPIISETNIKSNDVYFFNVQKIVLLEDRHKKSASLMISGLADEKEKSYYHRHQKMSVPNSKLIKEINFIKEKLTVQKIIDQNQEAYFQKGNNLPNIINIKSLEYKPELRPSQQKLANVDKTQFSQEGDTDRIVLDLANEKRFKKSESLGIKAKNSNSPSKRLRRKFIMPFQTYYYRDLLWKVNFTNSLYVEVPLEYEHRLKVFVGKGNNSCMVSGLITRRHWFSFTDRVEQANFVWTQLKQLTFLNKQMSNTDQIPLQQRDKGRYQSQLILTTIDSLTYQTYFNTYFNSEQHGDQRMLGRQKAFKYRKFIKSPDIKEQRLHNHLINNYVIGNKKALFNTMSNFYHELQLEVFEHLPLTFHIKDGMEDNKYFQFLKYYHKRAKQITKANQEKGKMKEYNAWIVKPGENSNRGNGIKMCLTLQQIKSVLKKRDRYPDGSYRTYIVQAYIERPLLYFKRKFDLRHYILITCINGMIKGYWYKQGYVRTTSNEYSLSCSDGSIHLTNDAVQKNLPDYGKYQKGNKISYDQLSAYIEKHHKKTGLGFYQSIYPKMKKMGTDAMKACSGGIDPDKLQNNFEIFGMDFMIDANLDVWLIQINTNPCLELSCPLLSSIIPKMVENTLELTMDAIFPPPVRYCPKGLHYLKQLEKQNKFELVYDERLQRLYNGSQQVLDNKLLEEEDDTFEDCGDEWEDS